MYSYKERDQLRQRLVKYVGDYRIKLVQETGLSTATVSKFLNQEQNVSTKNQKLIFEAAVALLDKSTNERNETLRKAGIL